MPATNYKYIQYKSDFLITLSCDAGWATPFCIKFWTDMPGRGYFVGMKDGVYTSCKVDGNDPTKLVVLFDDHGLGCGDLMMQMAYHVTEADFPTAVIDQVQNQQTVTTEIDGTTYQVALAFEGEDDPEIIYELPAYYNELQRIQNELARQQAEAQRVQNEQQRVNAEQQRVNAEQGRVNAEAQRVSEFATLKHDAQAATAEANDAAALAGQKAQYAQEKGDYAKNQGDYAKQKGDEAAAQMQQQAQAFNEAQAAREQTFNNSELARTRAFDDSQAARQLTYETQEGTERGSVAGDGSRWGVFKSSENARRQDYEHLKQDMQTATREASTAAASADIQARYAKDQGDYAKQKGDEAAAQMQQQAQAFNEAQAARQATFEANEAARDAEVDAKVADITNLQDQVAALEEVVSSLTMAEGYVRVAGSSSPALSYKAFQYDSDEAFDRLSAFSLFYPCLVGTKLTGGDEQVGKILHILRKLDWGHDLDGNARLIDGSEGDVMICNIEPYYRIMGQHVFSGAEYDVFLLSRKPFIWQGIEAERVEKFGWSPDYTVSHLDEDNVQRMHSVFNPLWAGSYTAPIVDGKFIFATDPQTGEITESYNSSETLLGGSGGLHTTDKELYTGEQEAMNHNPDTTKCVPFMNQTAAGAESLQCLLLAEGGTFDAHNATLMGSGFCANDGATEEADWAESATVAKNGLRVMNKDGVWKYYSLAGNIRFLNGATTGTTYAGTLVNSWRNPWHIMEAHRAVCHAIQNGVHELEWFTFEGNKYKWRGIDGFAGPNRGEMTCVIWKLMVSKAKASAIDPDDASVSIAGNRVEMLVSTALLHGMLMQVSPAWNMSGMIMTEDDSGAYECYMERDQSALIKSENGEINSSEQFDFERLYQHILSVTNGSGYAKNYSNEALMLPNTNANKTGGGLHTYVGKYNYFSGTAASAGKKLVRAWRRGNFAHNSTLSPLFVYAYFAPSSAGSHYAFGTCVRILES